MLEVTITSQPHNVSFSVGEEEKAMFNVSAKGSSPISYQWLKDDKVIESEDRIEGADKQQLTIMHPTEMDEGKYHCVLRDDYGEVESQKAVFIIGDYFYTVSLTFVPRLLPVFNFTQCKKH